LAPLCDPIYVEVRGKKVEISEDVVRILNNYAKMEYSLEKLAQDLGLESWEEAYEFIKAVPAWILWISPTLYMLEKKRCQASGGASGA